MTGRIWFFFIAALAITASVNGSPKEKNAARLDSGRITVKGNFIAVKNSSRMDSGKVTVKGNHIAVNLYPDGKANFSNIQKKLKSLEKRLSALQNPQANACKFDFEDGRIGPGWVRTGTAFNNQPTYGDNPSIRNPIHSANQQGDWWIGGLENRPSKSAPAGRTQGNGPQGTLTSPTFRITGKLISFMIGSGCYHRTRNTRAELIIGKKVVKKDYGYCLETMIRKYWDVGDYIGQLARFRLIDFSSVGTRWDHINFDDLKGDISCDGNWNEPEPGHWNKPSREKERNRGKWSFG